MSGDWEKAPIESIQTMLAAVAIGMIEKDPELTERFRAELASENCPIPADEIDRGTLQALNLSLTLRGAEELKAGTGRDVVAEAGIGSFTVPVPRVEGGARVATAVLGLGGFLAEYMSKHPAAAARFQKWLDTEYPDSGGGEITAGRYRHADRMLTMMAHVTDGIAEGRVGPGGVIDDPPGKDQGTMDLSEAQEMRGL
jgi:hypothetical protein